MANLIIRNFYGQAQQVINSAVDVAAGNFSATTTTFDNTADALVPHALYAQAMIEVPDWSAAPASTTTISLWGLLINVDGTDDDTNAPSGSASGGAMLFGSWPVAALDALQRHTIIISLNGIVLCDFYIQNNTAANMNNDAGTNLVVKITPFSPGIIT